MQRRLKERLIGAAVLVMLAVIFIPMILDDTTHTESTITESNIPAKPETEFSSRIVPLTDSEVPADDDTVTDSEETAPAETTPVDTVPAEPTTAETAKADTTPDETIQAPAPASEDKAVTAAEKSGEKPTSGKGDIGLTAWVVQLGSFSSENNANNLNDKLHKAGYSSFVEPVKQGSNEVYRVRVGPELLRSDAQKLKDRLRKNMKLDGMLLPYP